MTRWRLTDRSTGEVHEASSDSAPDAASTAGRVPDDAALVEPLADGGIEVVVEGWHFEFDVDDARIAELRERASARSGSTRDDGPTQVRAIIPGRVVAVAVVAGDEVPAGARLLSVEAMKMENEVRAPRAGTVGRVLVAAGATVELGDILVELR